MLSIMACQQVGKFDKSLRGVYRPDNTRDPITSVPDGKVIMAQKVSFTELLHKLL